MLYLQKVFDDLSQGEYAQLNFGSGAGVINDSNMNTLISHVNVGLTDIYSRFELRFKTIQLALQPDQTEYLLTSKSALNGKKKVPPLFIIDSVTDRFIDDILQITAVKLDSGTPLVVNSFSHRFTAMTPSFNRLQIPIAIVNKKEFLPENLKTDNVFVTYKANHPVIDPDAGGFDPERFVIDLPMTHYTALLYFCAARATRPLGLNQQFNTGNTYTGMYEAECARLKNNGSEVSQTGQQSKFHARGFV